MFRNLVNDFIAVFYPRVCFACGHALLRHEEFLCLTCLNNLPKTDFHLMEDNPVATQFLGKININAAASYYYFTKGGNVQHLIHQFKYKGFKEIGYYIGQQYGKELIKSKLFSDVEYIIPIPLHPSKEAIRGYNQSEWFASGLASSMNAILDITSLIRVYNSETQTHKTRFDRWENVKEIFSLNHHEHLIGKHILLADDVITTGSTLEAAGNVLLKIPGIRISICSMACALH